MRDCDNYTTPMENFMFVVAIKVFFNPLNNEGKNTVN